MKTMTCQQLGGPCGHKHQGDSADDVIKAQDKHLHAAVKDGDHTHDEALQAMKGRWKHPIKGMGWYREAKQTYAALPDD